MWTDAYVGLPFKRDGRGRDGLDCFGLIALVYRERLGIVLPDQLGLHTDSCPETLARIAAVFEAEARRWRRVEQPAEHDVVLMRHGPLACHVGVFAAGGFLLHVAAGIDSTCELIARSLWRRRIVGYFRHAE